jgi:hypothetical protein
MGAGPDKFYFTHPVELGGTEQEGGAATPLADQTQIIPVDILRGKPQVNDILIAHAIGGRWVAEEGGSGSQTTQPCQPCEIPRQDLTVSWVNPIFGNGQARLVFNASGPSWSTGCSGVGNDNIFTLACLSGQIEFRVVYFLAGVCPTGQSAFCSNLLPPNFQLVFASHVCDPLSLVFTVGEFGCPGAWALGYQSFTVTS